MNRQTNLNFLAAVVLFFISGCTSLVYETVWIRILSLAVGSTAAAVGITLAIFFTGLGIGGALSGKITALKSSFKIYAVLEAVIGISSALTLLVLLNLNKIVAFLQPSLALDVIIRYGLVTLTLILPTTAMGATLPALISYFTSLPQFKDRQTSVVSFLYGLNTLGGACGAILGSYLIIPYAGLLTGTLITCVVNVLLAVFAYSVAAVSGESVSKKSQKIRATGRDSSTIRSQNDIPTTFSIPMLYLVAAISGFSSISAEVVWNKYLAIFFGTNIFGIGTILGIFLCGLAVGPFVLTALAHRIKFSMDRVLVTTLFLAAVLTSLTSYALGYAPYIVQWAAQKSTWAAENSISVKAFLAVLFIFPTAAIYGVLFPLVAMQLTYAQRNSAATSTGYTYAVNTAGSVAGSLAAGLWLVPAIGSYATSAIAAASYAVVGIYLFLKLEQKTVVRKWAYGSSIAVAVVACMMVTKFDFRAMIESARTYRSSNIPLGQEDFKLILEGQNTVVSLSHDPLDGTASRDYLRLKTSGLYESVFNMNGSRMLPRYEGLLGLLPWLARSDAQNVFVVGFGAGYTVDLLTSLPIAHVQVVELEKAVIDAFRFATPDHEAFLGRKNLDLSIDDARHVLQRSKEHSMDFIVSQPSHSWLPGSANLFTTEYFQLVHSKLKPNGVFAQWLNLYNSNEIAIKSILKSFFQTFPNGTVFTGENDDELILLGSDAPIQMNDSAIDSLLAKDHSLKQKMVNMPVTKFNDVLSFYLADSTAFVKDLADAPLNTDLNAFAEVIQSKEFYQEHSQAQSQVKEFLTHHFDPRFQGLARNFPHDSESQLQLLEQYRAQNQLQRVLKILPAFLQPNNLSLAQKARLAALLRGLELNTYALTVSGEVLKQQPTSASLEAYLGVLADMGQFSQLTSTYASYPQKLHTATVDCYAARAYIESDNHSADAQALTKKFQKQYDSYHKACGSYAGAIYGHLEEKLNAPGQAMQFYEEYLQSYPRDISILTRALALSAKLKDVNRSTYYVRQWKVQTDGEKARLKSVSEMYTKAGFNEDAARLNALADNIGKKLPVVN